MTIGDDSTLARLVRFLRRCGHRRPGEERVARRTAQIRSRLITTPQRALIAVSLAIARRRSARRRLAHHPAWQSRTPRSRHRRDRSDMAAARPTGYPRTRAQPRRSQCRAPCRPTARRGAAISGAGLQGRSRPRASSPLHRDQPPGIDLHPFIHLDRETAPQC